MPGWEALLEEHFQGSDVRPARRGERPLHRDFASVDAVVSRGGFTSLSQNRTRFPSIPSLNTLTTLSWPVGGRWDPSHGRHSGGGERAACGICRIFAAREPNPCMPARPSHPTRTRWPRSPTCPLYFAAPPTLSPSVQRCRLVTVYLRSLGAKR